MASDGVDILADLGSYLASCLFSVPQIVPQQCPTWSRPLRAGASKAFACLGELRRSFEVHLVWLRDHVRNMDVKAAFLK